MHHYELYRSQNQCTNGLGWSVESVYSVEPVDGVWMSRDDDLVQIFKFFKQFEYWSLSLYDCNQYYVMGCPMFSYFTSLQFIFESIAVLDAWMVRNNSMSGIYRLHVQFNLVSSSPSTQCEFHITT